MDSLSSLGLILEAPEAILAKTPFAQFDQLSEQLQSETGGAAVRLGLYRTANGDKATVRLVCASHQLPEGVRGMVAAARREGAQIRDKLQQTLNGLDLGEIAEFDLLPAGPSGLRRQRSEPAATPTAQPARPARAPAPPPAVERATEATIAKTSPATPSPSAERSAAEVSASGAASAAAASAPATAASSSGSGDRETSALAYLNTYDQLVRDYRNADSDAARQRVRERLEADRLSENTQVRYYVVRAMSKLDPALFSDALKAAMYDSDASVRSIATKALKQRA
jgi:hypothetical protein